MSGLSDKGGVKRPLRYRVGLLLLKPYLRPKENTMSESAEAIPAAVVEAAAKAAHDLEPWIYGQDVDGCDVTKPWEDAPESVREHYRDTVRVVAPILLRGVHK